MMRDDFDRCCALCENAQKIYSGEFYLCRKKGVVEPTFCCRKFSCDPLKIEVSIRKLPDFVPKIKR